MYKTSQKTFNTAWSKDGLNWKFRGYVKLDDIKVDYDGEFDAEEKSPYVAMKAAQQNAYEEAVDQFNKSLENEANAT